MQILFNILLLTIILYIFWSNIENFEATPPTDQIKEAVKQVYLADVESIRNLSIVAKKLQEDGALVTPTNMSIRGKLNINSPSNAKDLPANITLSVDNATETTIRLKTKADDAKNITLTNNDGNLTMGNAKGGDLLNIKSDGNVAIKQDLTTGSLTSSTIKAPGAMKIESTAITTTGSLTAGSLTTSGDTNGNNIMGKNIRAYNNLHFNGKLLFNETNSRDYTPVILTFDAITNNNNTNAFGTQERTFVLPQLSIVMCLWNEGTNNWGGGTNDRFWWLHTRMMAITTTRGQPADKYYRYCRHANDHSDYRFWRGITVSVPPGKACKIFGGIAGELIRIGPGYWEYNLPWSPHLVWAGIDDYIGDIPDNTDLSKKTGF